jgi:hypothetical protein
MRSTSIILLALLAFMGVALADEGVDGALRITRGSFEYELYHPRGAVVPFRLDVENVGPARVAYVVILVHEQQTGADFEVYSRPLEIPANGRATFGDDEPLTFLVERDGLYTVAAAVYTGAGAHDVRADILHERRLLYVGTARPRPGCFRQ